MTTLHNKTQVEIAIEKLQGFSDIYLSTIPPHIRNAFGDTVQILVDEVERLKKLSIPPDHWNNAPEWATHKATDKDGKTHWFNGKPIPCTDSWYNNSDGYESYPKKPPQLKVICTWKDTLQERPIK